MGKPSGLQASKTIHKILGALVGLTSVNLPADANNLVITTALTTVLTTASDSGGSVPLQVSTDKDTQGVLVDATFKLPIYEAGALITTQIDGNEVYGVISEVGGVYTLTFKSIINGTETTTTILAGNYSFGVPYRFKFVDYPTDGGITFGGKYVGQDPTGSGKVFTELVTVTALNTVSNLTKTPIANSVHLSIDGYGTSELTSTFSVAGKVITWDSTGTGANFNLETTDVVIATYTTNE